LSQFAFSCESLRVAVRDCLAGSVWNSPDY
jgi:hypothetical protein